MPAETKTVPTSVPVEEFLAGVEHPQRRADAEELCRRFTAITGEPPVMWGPSIVGFGSYHYRYESGREGDACAAGFSPRSTGLVVYLAGGVGPYEELLDRLGPHKASKGCLYVKRLADVDMEVLEELVGSSYRYVLANSDVRPRPS